MSSLIKSKNVLLMAFEADSHAELRRILLGPLDAYVELYELYNELGYDALVQPITEVMREKALHKRFSGNQWNVEKSTNILYMPDPVRALLLMPSILSNIQNLSSALVDKVGFQTHHPKSSLEMVDFYLTTDIGIYSLSDILGKSSKNIDLYLDRVKLLRQAMRQAESEESRHRKWFSRSLLELKNDPVSVTVACHLLKMGPAGVHGEFFQKAFARLRNVDFQMTWQQYLAYLDAFYSMENVEAMNTPQDAQALEEIFIRLCSWHNNQKEEERSWCISAIKEFHRIFHKPGSNLVAARRELPPCSGNGINFALSLMQGKPSTAIAGIVAEYVSTIHGDSDAYKVGRGNDTDLLVELAQLPLKRLTKREKQIASIKAFLDGLYIGTTGVVNVVEAMNRSETANEAEFFASVFPQHLKRSDNPWIRDIRMSADLGL